MPTFEVQITEWRRVTTPVVVEAADIRQVPQAAFEQRSASAASPWLGPRLPHTDGKITQVARYQPVTELAIGDEVVLSAKGLDRHGDEFEGDKFRVDGQRWDDAQEAYVYFLTGVADDVRADEVLLVAPVWRDEEG